LAAFKDDLIAAETLAFLTVIAICQEAVWLQTEQPTGH
jgi:hypothetical protein